VLRFDWPLFKNFLFEYHPTSLTPLIASRWWKSLPRPTTSDSRWISELSPPPSCCCHDTLTHTHSSFDMQRRKKKKRTRFLKTQSKLQSEMRERERERNETGVGFVIRDWNWLYGDLHISNDCWTVIPCKKKTKQNLTKNEKNNWPSADYVPRCYRKTKKNHTHFWSNKLLLKIPPSKVNKKKILFARLPLFGFFFKI
jgi:hypothetical protein